MSLVERPQISDARGHRQRELLRALGLDECASCVITLEDMAPLQRDQVFQLRMTAEEKEMLAELAERDGLTAADKVRQWIRREYAATSEAALTAKRPKLKRK